MKILMLNYEFPPLGGGGGLFSFDLAKELAKRHKVDVITSHFKDLSAVEIIENVTVLRVPVLMRTQLSTATIISMISFPVPSIIKGINLFIRTKYDVINTHFAIPTGPTGFSLSKVFKAPNILSLHGGDVYDPTKKLSPHRNPILRQVVKKMLKTADIVVAQSNATKQKAKEYYGVSNIEIIPLGLTKPVFNKVTRSELGLSEDNFFVIAVGRLLKRKGYEYLIKAVSRIQINNIRLLIIGDGPEKNNLMELTSKLGISKKVLFLGVLSNEKKYQYLSVSDIFALAPLYEPFGLVFLEAMYCGLPIVTTDCGGQTDFLKDGQTGFFVSPCNEALLAEKISLLINTKPLAQKISNYNREYVKNFLIQVSSKKYEQLFYQAINRGQKNE